MGYPVLPDGAEETEAEALERRKAEAHVGSRTWADPIARVFVRPGTLIHSLFAPSPTPHPPGHRRGLVDVHMPVRDRRLFARDAIEAYTSKYDPGGGGCVWDGVLCLLRWLRR